MLAITCQLLCRRGGGAVWGERGRVGRAWALELHAPVPVLPALLLLSVYFCVSGKLPTLGCGDSDTREREDMHTSL